MAEGGRDGRGPIITRRSVAKGAAAFAGLVGISGVAVKFAGEQYRSRFPIEDTSVSSKERFNLEAYSVAGAGFIPDGAEQEIPEGHEFTMMERGKQEATGITVVGKPGEDGEILPVFVINAKEGSQEWIPRGKDKSQLHTPIITVKRSYEHPTQAANLIKPIVKSDGSRAFSLQRGRVTMGRSPGSVGGFRGGGR